jgi:cytoskeleton protein RodZ
MATPSATASLGTYLRALREGRQGSLDAMAHATRISANQLHALEMDDFAELPSPVFVKGFIRAYCQHLGIPSDEALARYRDVLGEPSPSELPRPPARLTPSWTSSPIFLSLLLLVAFGGGLLALNLGINGRSATNVAPAAPRASIAPSASSLEPGGVPESRREESVASVESAKMVAGPIASDAPAPPPPPSREAARPGAEAGTPASPQGIQRLSVKVVDSTWLRLQIDDDRTIEEMLPIGATREWTAKKQFMLTIGNAGGIELMLNGRAIPPLGGRGAVIRGLRLPEATPAS